MCYVYVVPSTYLVRCWVLLFVFNRQLRKKLVWWMEKWRNSSKLVAICTFSPALVASSLVSPQRIWLYCQFSTENPGSLTMKTMLQKTEKPCWYRYVIFINQRATKSKNIANSTNHSCTIVSITRFGCLWMEKV